MNCLFEYSKLWYIWFCIGTFQNSGCNIRGATGAIPTRLCPEYTVDIWSMELTE